MGFFWDFSRKTFNHTTSCRTNGTALSATPHPGFTWWSNRGQAYAKNVGWRIDYQVVTPNLKDKIQAAAIFKDEKFSDHAPLIIDYDISRDFA